MKQNGQWLSQVRTRSNTALASSMSLDTRVDHRVTKVRGGANLMPAILEAVESYATVGEIAESLRQVFGEYQPAVFSSNTLMIS